jgi:enoyl-[acyl-carrier protein] reductase II
VLVPAVVDAVKIPVLAAGGIVDSRGYRAAFALGAQGVQVGTAFMISKECIVLDDIKNLMIEAAETDTALMGSGRAFSRTLLTPDMKEALAEAASSAPGSTPGRAVLRDAGFKTTSAGQCVGLLREVRSVREIIEEMAS